MDKSVAMSKDMQKRGFLWHIKWLFACYAASLGLFLLAFTISLLFSDEGFGNWWSSPVGSIAMLATAVAISPLIYKWLR